MADNPDALKLRKLDNELRKFIKDKLPLDLRQDIAAQHGISVDFVTQRLGQLRSKKTFLSDTSTKISKPNSTEQFSHLPTGHQTLLGLGNLAGNGISFLIVAVMILICIAGIMSIFE